MVKGEPGTGVEKLAGEVVSEKLLRVLHVEILAVSGHALLTIVAGNGQRPDVVHAKLLRRKNCGQEGCR